MKNKIHQGDVLTVLKSWPDEFVDCVVTSPPYWGLRMYLPEGHPDKQHELGLEKPPEEYIAKMVEVFREVRRVLKKDGTCWVNMGDSYHSSPAGSPSKEYIIDGVKGDGAYSRKFKNNHQGTLEMDKDARRKAGWMVPGLKPKDLCGIPWLLAFALRADGWYLRQDIIWHKPNPMPESVTDRCTKAHEYIFLLTKSAKYYYDAEAVKEEAIQNGKPRNDSFKGRQGTAEYQVQSGGEGGEAYGYTTRNRRSVWTVVTEPCTEAHFAVFPKKLIEPCILAGSPKDGLVLDPFMGSGTTAIVAFEHGRDFIGIELNPSYIEIAKKRLAKATQQGRLF